MPMTVTVGITCDYGCEGAYFVAVGETPDGCLEEAEEASWRVRRDPRGRSVVQILCPTCAEAANKEDRLTATAIARFLDRELGSVVDSHGTSGQEGA